MTADIALKLGMAAGWKFTNGERRHTVVIGKDTRLSGYMLESALTAGFSAMGMDVFLSGPLPTPAIPMLVRSMRADLGVMISASHNPFEDNGIKFFSPDGYKLSDTEEAEIERYVDHGPADGLAPPARIGRVRRLDDSFGRYVEYLKHTFPQDLTLDGMKVVVDCANGAAYRVAPTVLWELGATVVPVGVVPGGRNIHRGCGAVDVDFMREEVVKHGADLGLALDGDADRLIVSDENGRRVDGDQLIALIARRWKDRDMLKGGGVVTTVMSNLGLEKYLEEEGLSLVRTQVGDRYVVERMRQQGFNLGGEQSGHIVLGKYSTTGDGMIAALQVCAAVKRAGRPASEVLDMFAPYPQILRNVRLSDRSAAVAALQSGPVQAEISSVEKELGDVGRIVIRTSGTEPLVRIMLEGPKEKDISRKAERLANAVEKAAS